MQKMKICKVETNNSVNSIYYLKTTHEYLTIFTANYPSNDDISQIRFHIWCKRKLHIGKFDVKLKNKKQTTC